MMGLPILLLHIALHIWDVFTAELKQVVTLGLSSDAP